MNMWAWAGVAIVALLGTVWLGLWLRRRHKRRQARRDLRSNAASDLGVEAVGNVAEALLYALPRSGGAAVRSVPTPSAASFGGGGFRTGETIGDAGFSSGAQVSGAGFRTAVGAKVDAADAGFLAAVAHDSGSQALDGTAIPAGLDAVGDLEAAPDALLAGLDVGDSWADLAGDALGSLGELAEVGGTLAMGALEVGGTVAMGAVEVAGGVVGALLD